MFIADKFVAGFLWQQKETLNDEKGITVYLIPSAIPGVFTRITGEWKEKNGEMFFLVRSWDNSYVERKAKNNEV